ncbi:EF-hand domain-containing protein [Amycolatopsis sp. WGS_07]|uniref:EF-hand domain-containing protein n=1 Tax=Amycolatopsis sp. WGS_07 TaxID=3076764 RepID=UPI00387386A0
MTSAPADSVDALIEAEFDKLDLNHDGRLDWADYEILIDRYRKTAGVNDDDRRIQELRAFYQLHWLELLRHSGASGDRLSRNEFVEATRRTTGDANRLDAAKVGGHVIFDLVDADGDGSISRDELGRYLQGVWQIDQSDPRYDFDALDTNKDGVISREEFVSGIQEILHA